jgi:hypothetical protein
MEYVEKESKYAIRKAQKQTLQINIEKARSPDKFGPQTHVEAVQAQHATAMRKAVAGRQHLGAAAPGCACTPACRHRLPLPHGVSWWLLQGSSI